MTENKKSTQITRDNIIEAFWQIYCKEPIEKIRVSTIMQRAGYNRGTFYEYFSCVEDVLYEIENRILEDIYQKVLTVEQGNLYENTDEIIDMAINTFLRHKKYLRVLLGPNGDLSFSDKVKTAIMISTKYQLKRNLKFDFNISETALNYILEFIVCGVLGSLVKWLNSEDKAVDFRYHDFIKSLEYFNEMYLKLYKNTNNLNTLREI